MYFSVSAAYSAHKQHTPQDDNGNRFMFYACVLIGEYTQGKEGLILPPPKDSSKSATILYDSVVDNTNNPNVFVVFGDAQCYPEYLITFR